MPCRPSIRASLIATAAAALLSGAPSTAHSLVTRRSLLATVRAAAALVPGHRRPGPPAPITMGDLVAGAAAHIAVSLFWGTVLARILPPGRRARWGAVAGVAIHLLDLGLVARLPRLAPIRALPQLPQLGDHIAFGATIGFVLDALDALDADVGRDRPGRDDGPAPAGTDPSSANRRTDQSP